MDVRWSCRLPALTHLAFVSSYLVCFAIELPVQEMPSAHPPTTHFFASPHHISTPWNEARPASPDMLLSTVCTAVQTKGTRSITHPWCQLAVSGSIKRPKGLLFGPFSCRTLSTALHLQIWISKYLWPSGGCHVALHLPYLCIIVYMHTCRLWSG